MWKGSFLPNDRLHKTIYTLPMLYDTILIRAERRLLNLHTKVKDAHFLLDQRTDLDKFISPVPVIQPDLADAQ